MNKLGEIDKDKTNSQSVDGSGDCYLFVCFPADDVNRE
jgi:hypothetical protein